MVSAGALVPHAPLLLPQVNPKGAPELDAVRAAMAGLGEMDSPGLVVLSPHGPRAGVYRSPIGSLEGFGIPRVSVDAPGNAGLTAEVARSWGADVLDEPADYGVLLPLLLTKARIPVVAATLPECSGPGSAPIAEAWKAGQSFAEAIAGLDASVFVFLSAHTSAALGAQAPLTERPAGRRLHESIVGALESEPGLLRDIPASLWEEGGSCGAGVFAALAELYEGRPLELLANTAPYGVGYVVATTRA